jgi:hypothetical protein
MIINVTMIVIKNQKFTHLGYTVSVRLLRSNSLVLGSSHSLTITKAVSILGHCWFCFEVTSLSKDKFAQNI